MSSKDTSVGRDKIISMIYYCLKTNCNTRWLKQCAVLDQFYADLLRAFVFRFFVVCVSCYLSWSCFVYRNNLISFVMMRPCRSLNMQAFLWVFQY